LRARTILIETPGAAHINHRYRDDEIIVAVGGNAGQELPAGTRLITWG
jgi:hypothetical protein